MRFHLASALSGLGVAGLVLLLTSQGSLTVGSVHARVEYMPHPRDLVQISGGAPYTVPAGKILVVTALGSTNGTQTQAELSVDGQLALMGGAYPAIDSVQSMHAVATGLSVHAGSVVAVALPSDPSNTAKTRAWGYLADD